MHKLLQRQLKKAAAGNPGEVDYELLLELVGAAYEEADRERQMSQRSMGLMSDEMLELNRGIEAESEARLRAQEQLIDAIENQNEAFALFDADDRLIVCNGRYKEFFFPGLEDEVAPGRSFEALLRAFVPTGVIAIPPGEEEAWVQERLARHRNPREPFERQVSGGRWILTSERRTRAGGMVGVHTDISARKRAEQDLLAAKETAEFASRSKSEFLANMSHELRTPLNAVLGFSEMMMGEYFGPLGERYLDYAKDIHDSGTHLLSLINDLLDLSKIEAGKYEMREAQMDIGETVQACLRIIKERAAEAEVRLVLLVPEDLPPVRADHRAIKQILLNLLSNAVKFTPTGGKITIEAREGENRSLQVSVVDTGIGVAAQDIAKVLAPFGQVDSSLSRKHQGTGLGLPLVKSLVEMHGGTFDFKSEPNVGTNVTFSLPPERVLAA